MHIFNDRTINGTVSEYRQAIERQRHWVEREVASHPEAGLLLARCSGYCSEYG